MVLDMDNATGTAEMTYSQIARLSKPKQRKALRAKLTELSKQQRELQAERGYSLPYHHPVMKQIDEYREWLDDIQPARKRGEIWDGDRPTYR